MSRFFFFFFFFGGGGGGGGAEETSTYFWSGFCTVNCRPSVKNYYLSHREFRV